MTELCELTAAEVVEGYARGAWSPVEVLNAVLARIEALNPQINALFHVAPSSAAHEARASQARWLAGQPLGPLDGVPVSIKDSVAVAGMPMPKGARAHAQRPWPSVDSPPAARLREAGAVLFAKSTMPDFGKLAAGVSTAHGITRNPWSHACNTGGSSSGAAAAVAAGFGPLAVGTDLAGSIRLPAALCGVVGMKPSAGRVPHLPPSVVRNAGPISRTVRDAAIMLEVLAGADSRDHSSLPPDGTRYSRLVDELAAGRRIGLVADIGFGLPVENAIRTALEAGARALELAGAKLERLSPLLDFDPMPAIREHLAVISYGELDAVPLELRQSGVHQAVRDLCTLAERVSSIAFARHLEMIERIKTRIAEVMSDFDALLLPVTPVVSFAAEHTSPDLHDNLALIPYTLLFNQTGQPAISVPYARDESGMPIGLQIVGRRHDDLCVLQLAAALEATSNWRPGLAAHGS